MKEQTWLEDEQDYYTVILDGEGKEKASWRDEGKPWDLEGRLYEEWNDKKALSMKAKKES